jgi:hypothetical protein
MDVVTPLPGGGGGGSALALPKVSPGSADHVARIAGARSVSADRWRPLAPGSWEQHTTVLPGESAAEVIRELEAEASEAAISTLLSPAARSMIVESERRVRAMEGTDAPPPPTMDELEDLEAYRRQQKLAADMARAELRKQKKAEEGGGLADLESNVGLVGRLTRRAGRALDPLWWAVSLYWRVRTALSCPKSYDVELLEQLGTRSIDTGDVVLFGGGGGGMLQCVGCSPWVHAGVVVRAPPRDLVSWRPDEAELAREGDGGYVAAGEVDSDEEAGMDEARWEPELATKRSRLFLYEVVCTRSINSGEERRGEGGRGGAQLVPLRHRLRHAPPYTTVGDVFPAPASTG